MKKRVFIFATFILTTIFSLTIFAEEPQKADSTPRGWTDDFGAAKKQAIKENKILLVNFTGTDWCKWCQVLEKEVLLQDVFIQKAKEDFVLVFIDVPKDLNRLSPLGKKQNKKIVTLYNIKSFPTMALMDPSGIILDRTGYQAGGPQKYSAMLKQKLEKNKETIQKFRQIHDAKGVQKAQMIDLFLSNKKINEQEMCIDWINEIIALDHDGSLGLRDKYLYFTDFLPLKAEVKNFFSEFFASRKNWIASIPQEKKKDQAFLEQETNRFYKEWDPKLENIQNKIKSVREKVGNKVDSKEFENFENQFNLLFGQRIKK